MHDGKNDMMKIIESLHPRSENLINDLAERFPGFVATDNIFGFSVGYDPTKVTLFGPVDDMGVVLRVHEGPNGLYVLGIDLLIAIARLLRVGPPTWSRSPVEMADWWKNEISKCDEFQVPEPQPRTREENEKHIAGCVTCAQVAAAMVSSINAGSSAYQDADVSEMVDRAHSDQAAAITFYENKRAAHSLVPTASVKPSRRKAAVEQVPA